MALVCFPQQLNAQDSRTEEERHGMSSRVPQKKESRRRKASAKERARLHFRD